MKSVIFAGLVLGSISYLVATQTDLLQGWATEDKDLATASASKLEQTLKPIRQQAENLGQAQLVQELQSSVTALKAELAQLTLALQEAKTAAAPVPVEIEQPQLSAVPEQTETALSRHQIEPDAQPASLYMPAAERSNALMDLVHRMEMKAAGY